METLIIDTLKLFFGPWHEKGEWLEEGGEWGPNEGLRHASGR
jgi:hypothetical protein